MIMHKLRARYLQSGFLPCSFLCDFFHKSDSSLRRTIGRLIAVASMTVLVDNPNASNFLFLYSRSTFAHGPQANTVTDDAESVNTFAVSESRYKFHASLHDPDSKIGIGL